MIRRWGYGEWMGTDPETEWYRCSSQTSQTHSPGGGLCAAEVGSRNSEGLLRKGTPQLDTSQHRGTAWCWQWQVHLQCIRARRRWTKPGQEVTPPISPVGLTGQSTSAELLLVPATFTQHTGDAGLRRPSAEAAGSVQRRNQLLSG